MIKTLLDSGIKLESVRDVFDYLREHVDADIASAHLVINGNSVVLCQGDELIDVVANGQGVLNVLSLAGVKHEVDTQLLPLDRRRQRPSSPSHAEPDRAAVRTSPLDAVHRALGAQMVPFGGWEMPLDYGSHDRRAPRLPQRRRAVRRVAPRHRPRRPATDAYELLQRRLTNDLGKIGPGRAQYTHLLDEADGSVLDDIIVWWHPDNGGRRRVRRDAERLEHRPGARRDRRARHHAEPSGDRGAGPAGARPSSPPVWPEAAAVGRFRVAPVLLDGRAVRRGRHRLHGRGGIEIAAPVDVAPSLWARPAGRGHPPRRASAPATRCGWRPGLPLHGHELGPGITPLQAGLGWVVGWCEAGRSAARPRSKPSATAGPSRLLVGIATEGRRPPRADVTVLQGDEHVGVVTSGNFSPVLGHGIALAFVRPDIVERRDGRHRRPRLATQRPRRADAVRHAADQTRLPRATSWRRTSSLPAFFGAVFLAAAFAVGGRRGRCRGRGLDDG